MPTEFSDLHVAVIMDGNGRWAQARGRPRIFGHRAGAQAVRRTVETARRMGIGTLTLYAFSSDNWQRPAKEVSSLMRLLRAYVAGETARCVETGIRVQVIGQRTRLPGAVLRSIEAIESATADCGAMRLRVAVDYSSREAILEAASRANGRRATREDFAGWLGSAVHETEPVPDVDLLIRTGGEQRISDFLLWEIAYAELYFTPRMWPDFAEIDFEAALREFRSRQRRFGRVEEPAKEVARA